MLDAVDEEGKKRAREDSWQDIRKTHTLTDSDSAFLDYDAWRDVLTWLKLTIVATTSVPDLMTALRNKN